MNHFIYAIASIVDANTGYGFAHGNGTRDIRALENRAREIRSKSVLAILGAARDAVVAFARAQGEKSRQRRAIAELARLSDYHLEDIGLTRGDVSAVSLGQVSLEELNENRRLRLSAQELESARSARIATAADSDAFNDDDYVEAKRA